jgi:hypothetical protein
MRHIAITVFALTLFVAANAHAASDSLFTVGVGTSVGVNHTSKYQASAKSTFSSDVSVRVKMLRFLALDLSFSPTETTETDSLVFDGKYRASALLFVLPTNPVAAYLKAGVGAGNISELVSVTGETNSYHAGAGLDINLTDNMVLSAEFLLLVPGVASIKNTIVTEANKEIARMADPLRMNEKPGVAPEVSDFISPENFRVSVGARWYF